jgi:4-amino-4-deoxy-L-arabinose transferase-like glycosyltransferase
VNITRQDGLICLGLFGIAAVLRFWHIDHLGLTHFDEGSYAMAGRWLVTFGLEGWVYQPIHAPGLFFTLIGLPFLIFGLHDTAAIAVSAVAGSLMVSLLYLIGRTWFNRPIALLAAL